MTPNKSKTRAETAIEITDKLQAAAAQLHKIYEPQWNARADVLKTIVSLSSASIVLSVTFSTSLRSLQLLNSAWRYLTLFSFSMFVASLTIALIALFTGTRVYEIQSGIFDVRQKIIQLFMNSATYEEFMSGFNEIQTGVNSRIARTDVRVSRLFVASSVTFALAVISLAVVGVKQILS